MPALFAFLNTNKYPASLDFLLLTLGPVIALIPLLEGTRGPLARWIGLSRIASGGEASRGRRVA